VSPLELVGLAGAATVPLTALGRGIKYLLEERKSRSKSADDAEKARSIEINTAKELAASEHGRAEREKQRADLAEAESVYLRKYLDDCQQQLASARRRQRQ
jgi:hypothetical protein